jgi:hypothetical protein
MRGGAIPVFLWGTVLLVLMVINVIWTSDRVQAATFGFAVLVIYSASLGLTLANREARRTGPPVRESRLEAVPQNSLASLALGVSIGAMMFGVVFGKFLVFIGGAVWLVALGRLIVEVRAQRRSVHSEHEQ